MNELENEIVESEEEAKTDIEFNNNETTTDEQGKESIDTNELVQLKADYEELHNKLMRVQADFDNYRKRTNLEKEELAKYINGQLIKALLPACDNFARAIESSKEIENYESLLEGIEMVYRQMKEILEKEGLEEIDALGKPFNPEYHQAVMQTESDKDSGIVIEELQKGFTFKGKVIRPSMVKVSI